MATRTIGRLAEEVGVSVDTVRYYERRGLLPEPERTDGGYRAYGADDAWRLQLILRAKELGFTLREVGELLGQVTDRSQDPATAVRVAAAAKLDAVAAERARLEAVGRRLTRLVAVCDEGDAEACASLEAGCGA